MIMEKFLIRELGGSATFVEISIEIRWLCDKSAYPVQFFYGIIKPYAG
jgi:hypothetical protein